ncbi:MAG: HAMP domain-containing histidine kinase [Candidatus Eremiobacteraeota bacterium]|nr:HAMP domain-containing histidine kinase [Candidatus Eremiobacteraeota bacterium]
MCLEACFRRRGYPGSLSQVLLNLLSNAQRYAYPEQSGEVKIGLSADQSSYCVTVRDFGPRNLRRAFEPFFTTGRGKGGSGLGLSIVHTIVTAHLKGTISLDSRPGEGTTVSLSLPREVPE